jgi:hypothetical protein
MKKILINKIIVIIILLSSCKKDNEVANTDGINNGTGGTGVVKDSTTLYARLDALYTFRTIDTFYAVIRKINYTGVDTVSYEGINPANRTFFPKYQNHYWNLNNNTDTLKFHSAGWRFFTNEWVSIGVKLSNGKKYVGQPTKLLIN